MVDVTKRKQRFYANATGKFAGSFDGGTPPKGLTEISAPPKTLKSPAYTNGAWREATIEPFVDPVEAAFMELMVGETKTRKDAVRAKLKGRS